MGSTSCLKKKKKITFTDAEDGEPTHRNFKLLFVLDSFLASN